MTDQIKWKRETAISRIEREQREEGAPPLLRSIAAAARFVGAEQAEVIEWWKARGR